MTESVVFGEADHRLADIWRETQCAAIDVGDQLPQREGTD